MRKIVVLLVATAMGCSGRLDGGDVGGVGSAATGCEASKIKLARADRRILPGGRFTFDVTITNTACANVPITFAARYPAFEDHQHQAQEGQDLTYLWALPPIYTWKKIGKVGTAITYSIDGPVAANRPASYQIDLDVGPAHFHDLFLDVTCSDGVYCNGEERFVNGTCSSNTRLPCGRSESDPCLQYQCLEASKSCSQTPVGGAACEVCTAAHCSPHCKNNWECGSDGCGGGCGTYGLSCPDQNGQQRFCIDGKCKVTDPILGSCLNPAPLFGDNGAVVPVGGIATQVLGNSGANPSLDLVKPECQAGDVAEWVYRFTLTNKQGFEIRMQSPDGVDALDTLLAIQVDCNTRLSFPTGTCSDDATPPGGLSSRTFGTLDPGTYVVIATGYSASQVGPFQLDIRFNGMACTPQCDAKQCGDDGCGGSCGPACAPGSICSLSGKCVNPECVADCSARQCGPSANECDDPNAPNSTCGDCSKGKVCDFASGQCVPQKACDPFLPDCSSSRPPDNGVAAFCGTDCQWHRTGDAILDLVPNNADRVKQSMLFQKRDFSTASCALVEGCVGGSGARTLLRFDTEVYNVGDAGFLAASPQERPDLFEYSSCHGHYHFNGFARFDLYTPAGVPAIRGGKLAYCMEDTVAYQSGPGVACEGASTCDAQGIQKGWTDLYARDLDCQWLDITGIAGDQWYCYEVCTNYARNFQEYSFDNNCTRFPVWVPADSRIVAGSDLLYGSVTPTSAPPSCNF